MASKPKFSETGEKTAIHSAPRSIASSPCPYILTHVTLRPHPGHTLCPPFQCAFALSLHSDARHTAPSPRPYTLPPVPVRPRTVPTL